MEQLKLSKDFARKPPPSMALCFQRTPRGRFVGTLSESEHGYSGHILAPLHAVLPEGANQANLGVLHTDKAKALALLALTVAKQSWDGSVGFEATCLQDHDEAIKLSFENWLIDLVCRMRASAKFSLSTETDERRAMASRIRADVATERSNLLLAASIQRSNGQGSVQ
jgi:hypothetical protein